MNRRILGVGCVLAGVIALGLLVVAGAAWWFLFGRYGASATPAPSTVQAFLIAPASGDEVQVGDYVSAQLNAVAPTSITQAELFVDGQSLGVVNDGPASASWTWQAWPVGVHTLAARATAANGETGDSQNVIINVVALSSTMQVAASDGETLDDVGQQFGVGPQDMAGANPHVDPGAPLKNGQPINVPTGGGGGTQGQPPGGAGQPPGGGTPGGGNFPFSVVWNLLTKEPVDKSYCYLSAGDGTWEKMPKDPFHFFNGADNIYQQILQALPSQGGAVQAQCWGWIGDALKLLGQAQGKVDGQQVVIVSPGFQLKGDLQPPPGGGPQQIQLANVVAPYALREPQDVADCLDHADPVLGGFVCNTLMKSPGIKQYIILEWEWQPKINWPTQPQWLNDIDGFEVLEKDNTPGAAWNLLATGEPTASHIAALPLGWGAKCYAVQAYAEGPEYPNGKVTSELAEYCGGQPAATQVVDETPSDWLTTANEWISIDCPGQIGQYTQLNQQTGFGNKPEILVGGNMTDDGDCFSQTEHTGGVLFNTPVLPPGAIVQKALLKLSRVYDYYYVSGTAGPGYASCVSGMGSANKGWGVPTSGHYANYASLPALSDFAPFTSDLVFGPSGTDVTPIVTNWIQHPSDNHGFIFTAAPPPAPPNHGGEGRCFTGLGNFHLEIHYFAP